MAEVLAEMVKWRRDEIRNTALQIVSFYTKDLAQLGTSNWVSFASRMIPVIMGREGARSVEFKGEAFGLTLLFPSQALNPIIREEQEVWEEREPRLVFTDSTFSNLSASYRGLIYKVNDAISDEARKTYKLHILKDPLSFVFSRHEYGRVEIERAVLLETF